MNRLLAAGCAMALLLSSAYAAQNAPGRGGLRLNDAGYFESPGINVMLFDDFYPEGHQGGLTIIQAGRRVAANGDVRLEPAPGQWSPVPRRGPKRIDRDSASVTVTLWYPDSSRNRTGFNPIDYPDIAFRYSVTARAAGDSIRVTVRLDEPLPPAWDNRAGFNLELFPGRLFGGYYAMDGKPGEFPRQADGPITGDSAGRHTLAPLASGSSLVVLPGEPDGEMCITSHRGNLILLDGRGEFNNGWFILRTTIPAGVRGDVVDWTIAPRVHRGWRYRPVVQVSEVGYHPRQKKYAVIELDRATDRIEPVRLLRIGTDSATVVREFTGVRPWGNFLRYRYLRCDFSDVREEGLYRVTYGDVSSAPFVIARDVFSRHVWQPTLEYFLPVQMCHVRVNDRYRVWHGLCHMDDARMAPVNHVHFDGYAQGASTLTRFRSGEHVDGLNAGGWHDAGDYDIRVESQAETVYKLALAYEYFHEDYDATTVDETAHTVELHAGDGKPDLLEQVEHGLLSIVGSFEHLGRLYRGMICPTLRQYVHLGDAATMSDNLVYAPGARDPVTQRPLPEDDRWVFTENNPPRELYVAQRLAAGGRVIMAANPDLGARAIAAAEELYRRAAQASENDALGAAAELYLTTRKEEYRSFLMAHRARLAGDFSRYGEVIGRIVHALGDSAFAREVRSGLGSYLASVR
ncbi:MAG TPA: glycoside hydrolase family 9 protein, partial [Bacteroidota bacterium]|nr:glycoside hydrolase family 9 protein [Bacteroidota bacterium]